MINRKTCNLFLKYRYISELSWIFLKNTNTQVLLFFSPIQSSRYISNEQLCLKTTGLYDDPLLLSSLFYFFYVTFNASISFSLWFPISPSLFFFMFFLKPLSSIVEKLSYTHTHTHTHIYIYIICIVYFGKLRKTKENLPHFDSMCLT